MTLNIDIRILKGMSLFASRDETRIVITNICLEIGREHSIFIATDGRRLAVYRVPTCELELSGAVDGEWKAPVNILLPVTNWARLPAKKSFEKVAVSVHEKTLEYRRDGTTLSMKLTEGNYPNWRLIIPDKPPAPLPEFSFRAEYVADAGRFATIMGMKDKSVRVCGHGNELEAFSVFCQDPEFYCCVMPVRSSGPIAPPWALPAKVDAPPPIPTTTPTPSA